MRNIGQTSQEIDLFRSELKQIINQDHPLVILADKIDWKKATAISGKWFHDKSGRRSKPLRLIVGLLLLKYIKNVSDEELPELWIENAYWQYFCGEKYFQKEFPIHPTCLSKWRQKMTSEDAEALLQLTIDFAVEQKVVKKMNLIE